MRFKELLIRAYFAGKYVEEFESRFATYLGTKYSNGQFRPSMNLLMIAALFYTTNKSYQLKRGDEVIVPAISWSTTYSPLLQFGLKLKFVDIDSSTLNYNLNDLSDAITEKTRVVFAVNLLGNSNKFCEINRLIRNKDIILLEDNCESLGATYDGKMTGSFGLLSSHSTFFSHHISTMEGGIISTSDEELYHILLSIRAHGWTRNLPNNNRVTGHKNPSTFEESFKFVLPGYNLRPLEMSGAVGVEQLKKLPKFIEERRKTQNFC